MIRSVVTKSGVRAYRPVLLRNTVIFDELQIFAEDKSMAWSRFAALNLFENDRRTDDADEYSHCGSILNS